MKISKLFHWLYAILMFLPVLFIGTRCLYTIFNKNAKDSYSETSFTYMQPVYYDSNEVEDYTSIISGNVYYFNDNFNPIIEGNSIISVANILLTENLYDINNNFVIGNSYILYYQTGNRSLYLVTGSNYINLHTTNTYLVINYVNNSVVRDDFVNHLSYAPNSLIKEYIPVQEEGTLDNAFIYSVNQLNEVPLFAWAKDSFLVTPFTYITGLFGVPSTSPINTMLSYWLDISIIWLVFDLVMYVPLIVHRWLDKGVLE